MTTTQDPSEANTVMAVGPPGRSSGQRSRLRGRESPASRFLRRFRTERAALAALTFLVVVGLTAIFAPWVAPYDPTEIDLTRVLEGPSLDHWLGTDDVGRDVFSRLVYAGRISLQASLLAVGIALVLGVPPGLVSGFFGGKVDNAIMRFNDALQSFPALILAITIIGFVGPGLLNAMTAVGIVFAPRFMRVVRGSALAAREETYVEAARSIGCSSSRIMTRHVLPNILSPLFVQITLSLGIAILAEASLSFLGLGVQPPESSWGSMLDRSFAYFDDAPVGVLSPGIIIMLTVLAFNLLGDGIRDALGREVRSA